MKHAELRAIVHNVADSLASGIGLLIGHYEMDVFGEASRSPDRSMTVDFLHGAIVDGDSSTSLAEAVALYRGALDNLCIKAGGSLAELREAKVRYWSDELAHRFTITVEDVAGRRSVTEYSGRPGRRAMILDHLGRPRRKPSVG